MKSFYHYLAESAKSYDYRIKSIRPITADTISVIERALFKYEIKDIKKPKKLMAQKTPLDFSSFPMAEVWILDITTGIPASSYVLAVTLRGVLNMPEDELVVRGSNEPLELEAEQIEEIHKDDQLAKLDDPFYDTEDQPTEIAYGDAYNKNLLNYLAQVKANGDAKTVPAIEEIKKNAKFAWLNPKDRTVADDFNAEFDSVKPVHVNTKTAGKDPENPNLATASGNYDDKVKRKAKK